MDLDQKLNEFFVESNQIEKMSAGDLRKWRDDYAKWFAISELEKLREVSKWLWKDCGIDPGEGEDWESVLVEDITKAINNLKS